MGWRESIDQFNVLRRAGLTHLGRPDRLWRAGLALRHYGLGYAAGIAGAAQRHGDRVCVIDERGTLTWDDVDTRTNAIANGMRQAGVRAGDLVAVMCRNHRGFVEATAALAKTGASVLLVNTAFAGPQLREVLAREKPAALVHDDEFSTLLGDDGAGVARRFVAWQESDGTDSTDRTGTASLDELIAEHSTARPPAPGAVGQFVILTSGTTGTPKGASRQGTTSTGPAVAMLERIPYRAGDVMALPAPLFHAWGFGNFSIGILLGATFVLRRRFDAEQTLRDIERHEATVLAAVPVMLQRILALGDETIERYDTRSLRIVPLSGSAIPAGLAERFMDTFGEVVYNLYGSTEVGWASIATPQDLRAAPGTAGRPPWGTVVKLLDGNGREVPAGSPGGIYVGSELTFDGYTTGGSKPIVDGLMSTGDTGRFDADGRLFVEGRDDDMIVSGGENVFPREVEDVLAGHGDVADVAVIGVDDDEFGQRLAAFVVAAPGSTPDEAELKAHVKSTLARFKVPRVIRFVDELPRNPSGKVLKRELAQTLS